MSWVDKFFGDKDKEKTSENPSTNVTRNNASATETRNLEMEAYYDGKMSVEEIDYRFQKMEELQDVVQPADASLPKDEVQMSDLTLPKGANLPEDKSKTKGKFQQNGANQPKGGNIPYIPRYFEEDTKLTVILVENTDEVAKYKDQLQKIVNSLVVAGKVCVINYGKLVRESKIVQAKDFECDELLYEEFAGNNACLYDALIALEGVVEKNYKNTEVINYKRIKIRGIEIIGIGRCLDNCSITSSQLAIESFCRVAKLGDVTTKYFCLTEESFMRAAAIGFHSIGAISRNYM